MLFGFERGEREGGKGRGFEGLKKEEATGVITGEFKSSILIFSLEGEGPGKEGDRVGVSLGS